MNQHASRPVAQGFPLHRRMNGPIQSAANASRTAQLRPSNPSAMTNGGPLRRSLNFKSQIPIRNGFGTDRSVSQSSLLRAQAHRRSMFNSTSQNSVAVQALQTSVGPQSIETVFKAYEDKLQIDLGNFRVVCSRLILKEQEEKEKWHTLCLKMMKERDTARQRASVLISERETHLLSPSVSAKETHASKRARDESSSAAREGNQELPSRSSPVETRPIRSLRSSPVPSPPGSPSGSLYNSSTAIISSSRLSASFPRSPTSTTTVPPTSTTPSPPCSSPPRAPLNIMTFNPTRSPNDKTCFDVFGVIDIPESRPVKRRKSYDPSSLSDKRPAQTTKNGETKDYTGPSQDKSNAEASPPRPFLIAHTDIMYMPMKGRLFCRACLLDKTTNPSSRNPKTFPTTVCWDELRDHCVSEHPIACADVARLCPTDLNELRRRLYDNR